MKPRFFSHVAFRAILSGAMALTLLSGCLSSKPRIKPVPAPPPVTIKPVPPAVVTPPSAPAPVAKPAPTVRAEPDNFPAVSIPGKVHVVEAPKPAPKPVPVATTTAPVVPAPDRPTVKTSTGGDTAPVAAPNAPISSDHTSSNVYRLRPGDQVVISLKGAQNQNIEDMVDEKGMITLIYLGEFKVDGLTASDVERKVRDAYIQGGIFKEIYVTAFIPTRRYTVSGEVKVQGPAPINGRVTLLQAIPAAGGFSDFADKKNIQITRTSKGTQITVDYTEIQRNPEKDIEIEPDDVITVPRKYFGL